MASPVKDSFLKKLMIQEEILDCFPTPADGTNLAILFAGMGYTNPEKMLETMNISELQRIDIGGLACVVAEYEHIEVIAFTIPTQGNLHNNLELGGVAAMSAALLISVNAARCNDVNLNHWNMRSQEFRDMFNANPIIAVLLTRCESNEAISKNAFIERFQILDGNPRRSVFQVKETACQQLARPMRFVIDHARRDVGFDAEHEEMIRQLRSNARSERHILRGKIRECRAAGKPIKELFRGVKFDHAVEDIKDEDLTDSMSE